MKQVIIFDIDGTLANNQHRQHYLTGEKKDWDKFYSEMDKDTPNEPVVFLCNLITAYLCCYTNYSNLKLIICTGRPENYRKQTEEWLHQVINSHGYHFVWKLIMRPEGDHRPDYQVKQEMLDALKTDGYEILFTVEDRKQVVDMWRANGITCLQCAEGDF